jgi:signal transduction histidine kinase
VTPQGRDIVTVEGQGASLVVWSSPYAPYFGADELQLLTTLAALTGIALDRVRLYTHEVETRVQLERLNDLKTNFVALAAHELRTPVTTIHGFVTTLNHLGDRLSGEQQAELRLALEQQTTRMALLVEQLLDLSRLDAEAIEIRPQRLDVRERVDDVLASAAGTRAAEVEVDVEPGLEVSADAAAFERVLSNLVTNALRYGAAPVTVAASQTDRHFRLSVEDHGRGVPPEFVPNLFERFARARSANDHVSGTGLGLAIARSYARAHGGDLVYEPATDGGARFTLVLPSEVVRE